MKNQIEKKSSQNSGEASSKRAPMKKMSEYGTQLHEKQKVKEMYGMREKQFRRFYKNASVQEGSAGENLLTLLERRLDNVVYRLKFAVSRAQARQMIVHEHFYVNGKKVHSPSMLLKKDDVVTLAPISLAKEQFIKQVVEKRLNMGIKVPDWLELNSAEYKGIVLRSPVRSDIQAPIQESLIVELYSK